MANYSGLSGVLANQQPAAISGTNFWAYRPSPQEKVLALRLLAVGADDETVTLDFGLYPDLAGSGRALGMTARGVFTLGTATETGQTTDPWSGTASFSSATLRHPDDVAWTWRDSDLQFLSKGEGANQSRTVYVDLTAGGIFVVAWQARSSTCARILVGGAAEGA